MPASAARSKLSLEAAGAPCQGRSNMASEGIIWATLPFGIPTQEWNQMEILQSFWNLRVGLPSMCILASLGLGTKATVSDTRPAEPATMMPRISGYCCRCNWLKSEISSNIKLCVGKLRTHHMDSYGSYKSYRFMDICEQRPGVGTTQLCSARAAQLCASLLRASSAQLGLQNSSAPSR